MADGFVHGPVDRRCGQYSPLDQQLPYGGLETLVVADTRRVVGGELVRMLVVLVVVVVHGR